MNARDITLTVNGRRRAARVSSRTLLSDFIRHELRLVGTHVGCEHGVCGACTINIDGYVARSCLMFAVQVDGATLTTIEGLAGPGALGVIQQAFWEKHGLQCGFCTPGMLMIADDLLRRIPDPTDEEIREAISANLCRCTGYEFIVDSIRYAAARLRQQADTPTQSPTMQAAQ